MPMLQIYNDCTSHRRQMDMLAAYDLIVLMYVSAKSLETNPKTTANCMLVC